MMVVRQSSSTVSSLSLYFPIFLPFTFLLSLASLLFLLFPCFTRPYITFLRCSDVKPPFTRSLSYADFIHSNITINNSNYSFLSCLCFTAALNVRYNIKLAIILSYSYVT